ncbi:hypothetical protein AMJ57_01910 [Parcubacteria bacterium SG8_24]|nr:MAG: hypothetical protein AMJ57_01910 [Parcubacteria bacterium SG8_24]
MPKSKKISHRRRHHIRLVFILTLILLLGLALSMWIDIKRGDIKTAVLNGNIGLIVMLLLIPFLKSAYGKDDKSTMSLDEKSRLVEMKAASYAFYTSLYIWLGISVFGSRLTIEGAAMAAIVSSAVIFLVAHLIMSRKHGI